MSAAVHRFVPFRFVPESVSGTREASSRGDVRPRGAVLIAVRPRRSAWFFSELIMMQHRWKARKEEGGWVGADDDEESRVCLLDHATRGIALGEGFAGRCGGSVLTEGFFERLVCRIGVLSVDKRVRDSSAVRELLVPHVAGGREQLRALVTTEARLEFVIVDISLGRARLGSFHGVAGL